ncbi:Murein hydrolase activator EnvC [Vibrio stylophorae]|uniref:Murein hydrolase activator EnvC n=1 Tax=Vibrio stylophorae TaxID=659351 RepID=A0ABM8ZWD7_9VIBR|nr:peptidoglycan DD-metalloendopeptidase family protein [Vibrio stylophorae]CAH0534660.1 Murein hydrolase activator EnvC [Vibrio stylophorae]
MNCFRQRISASALCAGVLLCLQFITPQAKASQLDGLQQEIKRQESLVGTQKKSLASLEADLKKHEVSMSQSAKAIRQAEQDIRVLNQSMNQLEQQLDELEVSLSDQKRLLAELLNARYRNGHDSQIKRLLKQQDLAELDRMSVYAELLGQARQQVIEDLAQTTQSLEHKRAELAEKRASHQATLNQRQHQRRNFDNEQRKRKLTLAKMRETVKDSDSYLEQLRSSENALKAQLSAAAKHAQKNQVRMDGLARYRKKLNWPIKGRLLHAYGEQQTSQQRWKGLVIAGKAGSEVKAIRGGKVVFADWLRGYGLVLVLDHGKGDMSLYGYNQSLLKNTGDLVKTGEAVALVGDSGGQERPSLYFEIRRHGNTVDPIAWLKRR